MSMSTPTDQNATPIGDSTSGLPPLSEQYVWTAPLQPLAMPEPIPDAKGSLSNHRLRELAKKIRRLKVGLTKTKNKSSE
jgi:hypothetical protein